MGNRDHFLELELVGDGLEVTQLLLETIGCARRLIGSTESQEIECHHAPPGGDEMRHEVIPNVQIVGKAVHEHERRAGPGIVPGIKASRTSLDSMLRELNLTCGHGVS
jgi:hypothetical protein